MTRRKRYPLSVEVLQDCCMSLGHHPPEAFLEAAAQAIEDPGFFGPEDVLQVKHEWWRHDVSCWDLDDTVYYRRAAGPGPGAFPVTVVT